MVRESLAANPDVEELRDLFLLSVWRDWQQIVHQTGKHISHLIDAGCPGSAGGFPLSCDRIYDVHDAEFVGRGASVEILDDDVDDRTLLLFKMVSFLLVASSKDNVSHTEILSGDVQIFVMLSTLVLFTPGGLSPCNDCSNESSSCRTPGGAAMATSCTKKMIRDQNGKHPMLSRSGFLHQVQACCIVGGRVKRSRFSSWLTLAMKTKER